MLNIKENINFISLNYNKGTKNKPNLCNEYNSFNRLIILLSIIIILTIITTIACIYFNIFQIVSDIIYKKKYLAICMLVKFDQIYLREFIEHYKKQEVDKIFIYDNNDKNISIKGLVNDYIHSDFVNVIKYPGKYVQYKIYKEYYETYAKSFVWNFFIDIDEFLVFSNRNMTLKKFLKKEKFNKCDHIRIGRVNFLDSEQIYYDNRTLFERFNETEIKTNNFGVGLSKYLVRPHLKNVFIDVHSVKYGNITTCDYKGEILPIDNYNNDAVKYERDAVIINHYHFRSTEEFIWRLERGATVESFDTQNDKNKIKYIKYYFIYNKITKEKVNLFKKNYPKLVDEIDNVVKEINNEKYNKDKNNNNKKKKINEG